MLVKRTLVVVLLFVLFSFSCFASESFKLDDISLSIGQPFYSGAIIPHPQQVEYGSGNILLVDGPLNITGYELFLEYFGPSRNLIQRLWDKKVNAYKKNFKGKFKAPDASQKFPIIVTLVSDPSAKYFIDRFGLHRKVSKSKPQGYVLEIRPEGILCAGFDNQGIVNGMASLLQLTHVEDQKLVVRAASILDWPVFQTRVFMGYGIPSDNTLDLMTLYKVNGFSTAYRVISWEGITARQRKQLIRMKRFLDYGTMDFTVQLHIGGRRPMKRLDWGDDAQIDQMLKTADELVNVYGVNRIMICGDDTSEELVMPFEKKRFKSGGVAQRYVVNRTYEFLRKNGKGTILSFCPRYYQGRRQKWWKPDYEGNQRALDYMSEIKKLDKNIRIAWTGPLTCSIKIEHRDLKHYRDLVGDRPLLYWDNTVLFHEPLANFYANYPRDFVYHCGDRMVYICFRIEKDPIAKFFGATASDYYWNPAGFDHKRSRKNAVAQFMSPGAVQAVERFYDFRGDGYYVHFRKAVDLKKFRRIIQDIEEVCYDKGIMKICWMYYNIAVGAQKKPELRHKK